MRASRLLTLLGIMIGVAYTIRAIQRSFFSGREELAVTEAGSAQQAVAHAALDPISAPERLGAAILIAITLLVGLQPRLLLDLIIPALASPLFGNLLKRIGT